MANDDRPQRAKDFNGPIYDQMAEDLKLTSKAQRTTCVRDWNVLSMLKLKNEKTLTEVITRQQVQQIILAATTRVHSL
jgi:hypothetical protein